VLSFRIPQKNLEQVLLEIRKRRETTALCAMGLNQRSNYGLTEFLFHRVIEYSGSPRISRLKEKGLYPVLVAITRDLNRQNLLERFNRLNSVRTGAGLAFVVNNQKLQGYYILSENSEIRGPAVLKVPGPGMEKMSLLPLREEEENMRNQESESREAERYDPKYDWPDKWRVKYERLAGGLAGGDVERGFELLMKAQNLRIFVLGAGRAGSYLVFRLAQIGAGSLGGLIIADPDTVELSNLDGMLVPPQALGKPKAYAVAATAAVMFPDARPIPINASLNNQKVVDALRTCCVVFSAVDENSARFAVSLIASRYHLIHIDVCGGSAWTRGKAVSGGELRIFIPGSRGCLACMGRYEMQDVKELLDLTDEQEVERRARINWKEQRPGSNVDVLLPLIGEAIQALFAILKGEIRESMWLHYEKDTFGKPIWKDWTDRRKFRSCPVCGKQAGLGDLLPGGER